MGPATVLVVTEVLVSVTVAVAVVVWVVPPMQEQALEYSARLVQADEWAG